MEPILQKRMEFNLGAFHVWAGEQLTPHKEMVVGHSHAQPHLMVLTRPPVHECPHCKGSIPQPEYVLRAVTLEGKEVVKPLGPFDIVYVKAGTVHSVEQTVDGALGGFACIFPRFDENGKKMDDPKHSPEQGVTYG